MRNLAIALAAAFLAGCAGMSDARPEQRSARNLCEAMRSFEPYIPDECGEHSGRMPAALAKGK